MTGLTRTCIMTVGETALAALAPLATRSTAIPTAAIVFTPPVWPQHPAAERRGRQRLQAEPDHETRGLAATSSSPPGANVSARGAEGLTALGFASRTVISAMPRF